MVGEEYYTNRICAQNIKATRLLCLVAYVCDGVYRREK